MVPMQASQKMTASGHTGSRHRCNMCGSGVFANEYQKRYCSSYFMLFMHHFIKNNVYIEKKAIEDVEQEVERLLQADAEAEDVRYGNTFRR
jgi:hypothetical protein